MNADVKILLSLMLMLTAAPAHAQLSRILREGGEALGKAALRKGAREAVQEGAELAVRKGTQALAREAAQESLEAAAKSGVKWSDDIARAAAKHGVSVTTPIAQQFGDDGARALANLSPANARRMAIMADDIAASGRGAEWMKLLSKSGDAAADWLWSHKGSVVLATGAAAFLAKPEVFVEAGETVAVKAIDIAGEDIVRPLVVETVKHTSPAVVQRMAIGLYVALAALPLLVCAACYWKIRPYWRRWFPKRISEPTPSPACSAPRSAPLAGSDHVSSRNRTNWN